MTMPNTQPGGFRDDVQDEQGGPGRGGNAPAGGGTQTTTSAREQIREVKDQVVGQAKTSLTQARDRATSSLAESKNQFADQVGAVAGAIRRTTEHLRSENQPRIAGLTDSLARQADQVADYLRRADGRVIRHDLEDLARRRPALVLGSALALGLLGARFLKSSERSSSGGSRGREGNGTDYSRGGTFAGGYGGTYDPEEFGGAGSAGGYGGSTGVYGEAGPGYPGSRVSPGPGGFNAGA